MYIIELLTSAGVWPLTVNNEDKKEGPRVAIFEKLETTEGYLKKNLDALQKIAMGWRIAEFKEFFELKNNSQHGQ